MLDNLFYNDLESHIHLAHATFYIPTNSEYLGNHIIKYGFNNITLTII